MYRDAYEQMWEGTTCSPNVLRACLFYCGAACVIAFVHVWYMRLRQSNKKRNRRTQDNLTHAVQYSCRRKHTTQVGELLNMFRLLVKVLFNASTPSFRNGRSSSLSSSSLSMTTTSLSAITFLRWRADSVMFCTIRAVIRSLVLILISLSFRSFICW
jgi:hypothetical protein